MTPRRFQSDDDFLAAVREAILHGQPIPEPQTPDELEALALHHPELVWRYLPSRECLRYMGLPDDLGKPVEPLPERQSKRIIKTLLDDPATWGRVGQMCIDAAQREGDAHG